MEGKMLLEVLKERDASAITLTADDACEWVRSAFGIVGYVQLVEPVLAIQLDHKLSQLVNHSYSQLEKLSNAELSFDELWGLLLLIRVPWTYDEAQADDQLAAVLARWSRNTKGSRKRIVWSDESLGKSFGPLGTNGASWMPSMDDPLHDAVKSVSRDDVERGALDVLFQRRIDDEDIDELLKVLARRRSE
jgi:hypothetical protein